ncbi:MAG TPA: hypothetical protein VFH74_01145 [Gaiellales bacterium]|nr:hypothetical protein [Gaiellales bacterium]
MGAWLDESADDDLPPYLRVGPYVPYIDGAWGRTANPNTADGELQNLAAFGNGLARLSGPRRTAAKIVVWLLLLGVALTIVYGVLGIISVW